MASSTFAQLSPVTEWRPDIVVGIDFGMTFTGVAYSSAPTWPAAKIVQHWAGKGPGELANKVPTCIEYNPRSGRIERWGFLYDPDDGSADLKEFFKLHLAPDYAATMPGGPSRADAQKWFADYVRCIYEHTIGLLSASIPGFAKRRVEFIFSVPTTWTDVRMVEETRCLLETVINAASPMHRVAIGLTEAEAAAVYVLQQHYKKGDVVLICDAGGGTTVCEGDCWLPGLC